MNLKEYIIANIKKNFWRRLSWIFFATAFVIMGDEYYKEGYLFHLNEVANPLCHEFWVAVFLMLSVLSYIIHKHKEAKRRS